MHIICINDTVLFENYVDLPSQLTQSLDLLQSPCFYNYVHVPRQNCDNLQEFHESVSANLQFSVNALKPDKINHSGFINVEILSKHFIALVDTGNSVTYDAVVKYDLCKQLNLPIFKKDIKIGSASQEHEMRAIGICRFKMTLIVNNKKIIYEMQAAVLSDLKESN